MRVVHCKREPYDVYIGRPSPWGNPYTHLIKETTRAEEWKQTREEAIDAYEYDLRVLIAQDMEYMVEHFFRPLAGKVLGCWCDPQPCHGDVLIKLCKELGLIE